MNFEFGNQWLDVHAQILKVFQQNVRDSGRFDDYFKKVPKGDVLFREGEHLNNVYILLEGQIQLYKQKEAGRDEFPVDLLEPGSFVGIIAYATGQYSLTTGRAVTDVQLLEMPYTDFEAFFREMPEISDNLYKLLLANLVERYRHTVTLTLKLEALNNELKQERNDLKEAYYNLKKAQSRLVHQEKMATLGQLVAGLAHEINNPVSALSRAIGQMGMVYPQLFKYIARYPDLLDVFVKSVREGLDTGVQDTTVLRKKMKEIQEKHPQISRRLARNLAPVSDEWLHTLFEIAADNKDLLHYMLEFFEFGQRLKNAQTSGDRIADLVKSLKNYSRQDESQREWIDVREGLQNTLQLVKNRIKYYELVLNIEQVPPVYGSGGELNQVWTNIILNACDAMGKKGKLMIDCFKKGNEVIIQITDTGPGVDPDILDDIFKPNVTTKRHGTQFGLGLGLHISKEIIEEHGGNIRAENAAEQGARFTVTLPAATE